MASDWKDLGTVTAKFLTEPNWADTPVRDFQYGNNLVGFPGTKQTLYKKFSTLPISAEYSYLNETRLKENTLLTFFAAQGGRWKKFWAPVWKNVFTMSERALAGHKHIHINNVLFHEVFQGYEHFFIKLASGDFISRKITDVKKVDYNYETIYFNGGLDRAINIADIEYFGRLILCRFDHDSLKLTYHSAVTSECSLRFYELVKEYE